MSNINEAVNLWEGFKAFCDKHDFDTNKIQRLSEGNDNKWYCPYCGATAKTITEEGGVCGDDEMHYLIKCDNCGQAVGLRTGSTIDEWIKPYGEVE